MSFNSLEVARAAEMIQSQLPKQIRKIEVCRSTACIAAGMPDLLLVLHLEQGNSIVVSLQPPWVGIFLVSGEKSNQKEFSARKEPWPSLFGGAVDWRPLVTGTKLERVKQIAGDRVVCFEFASGMQLRIELFPARPNWIFTQSGLDVPDSKESSWREQAAKPVHLSLSTNFQKAMEVREFEKAGPLDPLNPVNPVNWMRRAWTFYVGLRVQAGRQRVVLNAIQRVEDQFKRLLKRRKMLNDAAQKAAGADVVFAEAERLKSELALKAPNERPADLAQTVDETFRKYKKLKRTQAEVKVRSEALSLEIQRWQANLHKLKTLKDSELDSGLEPELESRVREILIEVGLHTLDAPPRKTANKEWEKAEESLGVKRFETTGGAILWVGRNKAQNETLVMRLAKGNDMWLHIRGRPGAHVILQLQRGKALTSEMLLDGATLAAYYSGVSPGSKVEIDYTYRKYVKRVSGQRDHFVVTYSQNKTLLLKLEEGRIWKLMGKT